MCIEREIHGDTELTDVAKLFFGDDIPKITLSFDGSFFCVKIDGNEYVYNYSDSVYNIIPEAHRVGRLSKIAVYDALSAFTNRTMPWGALTGVRPTKLFYECLFAGKSRQGAIDTMQKVYRISEKRAKVLSAIANAQDGKIHFGDDCVNLYVHIPFCTTRCSYCSFLSLPIDKHNKLSKDYVKYLCDEIALTRDTIDKLGKKVLSVYIGGGTPSALSPELLDKVLTAIRDYGVEYTCEAGRPDTITAEKCDIIKSHGVTRVCVNPQTLNDKTLSLIGRNHTADEFFGAYEIVKSRGFEINCDLIAGLPGETLSDFKASYDKIKSLRPQNFTVHSLAKKNGSAIRYEQSENGDTETMLNYALDNAGEYVPYYLYRQKRQSGNVENVGFSMPSKECINNITTMEETVSVVACGAGAISKTVCGGEIKRFANMRDVILYISRFAECSERKTNFLLNSFKLIRR